MTVITFCADIEWPSDLSPQAKDLISKLLTLSPEERLGYNGAAELKNHPFFADINWDTILTQKAPFIPKLEDPESTAYFQRIKISKRSSNLFLAREARFPIKDEITKELMEDGAICKEN
jgi:serine/threonine protein kinase